MCEGVLKLSPKIAITAIIGSIASISIAVYSYYIAIVASMAAKVTRGSTNAFDQPVEPQAAKQSGESGRENVGS